MTKSIKFFLTKKRFLTTLKPVRVFDADAAAAFAFHTIHARKIR